MELVEQFVEAAKGRGLTVVLPEGQDERVLAAARRLKDDLVAKPLLLGKHDEITRQAEQSKISLEGLSLLDPQQSDQLSDYATAYADDRGLSQRVATRMVQRPLIYAGMMVKLGVADTMVAGVSTATAMVIQAGTLTIGYAPVSKRLLAFS